MANEDRPIKHPAGARLFTVEEANQQLPKVRQLLAALRGSKKQAIGLQALVDVEEMTGGKGKEKLLEAMEGRVAEFHAAMESLAALGCELKDVEKGLFDFYAMRDNEIVFLCWMEGEDSVSHWHTLEEGFGGRKEI